MFNLKQKITRREEKQISNLSNDREETRKRIQKIKMQMDSIIRKAADGDDLDRKVCSADYLTLKNQLCGEMQHFEDVSRLIGQMRNAELSKKRAKALKKIVAVSNRMDFDRMIKREDYVSARREMLAEEDEQYHEAYEDGEQERYFREDEEFSRLVSMAKIRNSLESNQSGNKITESGLVL